MPMIQAAKNKLHGGANEHSRPISSSTSSSKQRAPSGRELHTEAYEYDGHSNQAPPAGEYLRAPVCCSECEEFWKALILAVDENHTSRGAAGKASLAMARGVLQIQSRKHVAKERRFFPGLGCKNVTVRGDPFQSCQSAARQISSNPISSKRGHYRCHESPQKKLSNLEAPAFSIPSPFANKPGLSRRYGLQGSLLTGYGAAPKYDAVTTPRRHSRSQGNERVPMSAVYPEIRPSFTQTRSNPLSSEASQVHRPKSISRGQDFEPLRASGQKRSDKGFSRLSTFRSYTPIYSESFRISHGLQHAASSPLKPFTPTTTRVSEKPYARDDFSLPATPRVYSPLPRASVLQEKQVKDFLHCNYSPTTPQTPSSRWDTQNHREHHMNDSARGKASRTRREAGETFGVDKVSPVCSLTQKDYTNSGHETPIPSAGRAERNLSRTSTIESEYKTLSIPRSNSSSNSLDADLDRRESKRETESVGFRESPPTDPGRPSFNIPHRNSFSRTSTGTSSLTDPILLFTGHGCQSETDEDDDVAVTNPNYFKHIITNPNYIMRIVQPLRPPSPPPPPGLAVRAIGRAVNR